MRTIVLPTRLDRTVTATLVPEVQDAAAAGSFALDGSKVERVGQSGLQLIVSARLTAASRGFACAIEPSASLQDAIRLAGLEALLLESPAS